MQEKTYEKTIWEDGKTLITANLLNKVEDKLVDLDSNVKTIDSQIKEKAKQLSGDINTLKEHITGGNMQQEHSHMNKNTLDKFSMTNKGELLFDGQRVIADIDDGGVNEDKLDEELVKKIKKVDSVEQKINAIITINENISKNLVPTSEIQYKNEYDIICHKYTHTNLCYLSFVFDVSKFKGQSVESHIQWAIETIAQYRGAGVQLNTISSLPPSPDVKGYLQDAGAVSIKKNDHTKQIEINADMIMLQFGIARTDGASADLFFQFSFNYFVNGEELKPIFAGPYFASDTATVNNARVGIKMIQDVTTTNDKETEIVFSVKNINMKGATVKLSVDGNVIPKTFTPSGEGYAISHAFEKITSYKCCIAVAESGGMTYKSNTFTVKSKDPNDISPSAIWVNANKIIVGGKTLTGKFEEIEELIRVLTSNLYKKKIVFIGDSICEQGTFINPLVSKTGCSVQNLGLSGSGWLARSPQNYITRIDQIEDIPDILVFYGSTNDIGVNKLGNLGDKDLTTYHGAIRGTLEKAILKYKHNTKYCVMTPLPTYYQNRGVRESFVDEYGNGSGSTSLSLEKMSKALRENAEALSIPCLDLYHRSNFFPVFPDGQVTGDGIHLSSQVAPITTIQKFLESII